MDKISVPGAPSAAVTNAPVNNAADTDAGVSTAQNVLPPSAAVTNAPVSDAAAVTDGGVPQIALPPPPRGPAESRPTPKTYTNPPTPLPCGSTSSAQTPTRSRGKQRFYVITKGRRTGVFDSWSVIFKSLLKF